MLRRIIVFTLFLSINSHAQTIAYLTDVTGPGSIDDIVVLLNLKKAKKISIYSRQKVKNIFLGEIHLSQDGKCIEKRSIHESVSSYHKYDKNGNLIEEKIFSLFGNMNYKHIEYKYNDKNVLIEMIYKDKSDAIIETDTNSLMLSIIIVPPIPTYIDNGETINSDRTEYSYNSDGRLIKYFSEGFYLHSAKSSEEEAFKRNKIEYTYEYNSSGKIKKYNKKLTRKSSVCELTAEFNYISDGIVKIEYKYSNGCNCLPCYGKLLYKIKYY